MKKGIFGNADNQEVADDAKLRLHKEELDIAKDRVGTGEVKLHKEIIEEHKKVAVPVAHDEVIIERQALDNEPSNDPIGDEEHIRIPTSEERVQVGKHTVLTGEISARKREVEETEEIDEVLKREEGRVDVIGNPDVVTDHELEHRH